MMYQAEDSHRLSRVETICTEMKHRLFGNGQPGIIDDHEDRIASLEKDRIRLMAYLAAIFLIGQFLTGAGFISLKALLGK